MTFKQLIAGATFALITALPAHAATENYAIDIKGQHAFIQFKIQHLGYSYELGSFRTFDGQFSYDDEKPSNNRVSVKIDTASLDTNHAERDKHLRSDDFFDVAKYPESSFVSTGYRDLGNGKGVLSGTFTLRGVSKALDIQVHQVGAGKDPWGGFRRGFEGHATLHLSDYHMKKGAMLGPVAEEVEIYLSIEGVRQ